jgi:hypothetical protein
MGCSGPDSAGYRIHAAPEGDGDTKDSPRKFEQIVNTPATVSDYLAEHAEAKSTGFDRQLSGRAFAIFILIWLALGALAVFAA